MRRSAPTVRMVPVATMVPWFGIRRGTLAVVPSVPGLVSVIVAPAKSSGDSLFVRAFSTTSSYRAWKAAKSMRSEERRVGKEGRGGWGRGHGKKGRRVHQLEVTQSMRACRDVA